MSLLPCGSMSLVSWPISWTDLVGHEQPARFLRTSVTAGRLAHAYLLAGPRGVGKALAARLFARAILCQSAQDGDACGSCASCRRTARGHHADLLIPDVDDDALEIKIEVARELREQIRLKPMTADRQVAIITDADRLNVEAENALLKTLEEPPGHAVLILTSSRAEQLLPTTRSRTVWVRFGALRGDEVQALLEDRFGIAAADAADLARYGAGSPGRALEASGDVVRALRSFVEQRLTFPSLRRADISPLAAEAEQLVSRNAEFLEEKRQLTTAGGRRVEALRLLSVMGLFLREAMLLALASGSGIMPGCETGAAVQLGETVRLGGFERAFSQLARAESAIRQNVRPSLVLCVLFARLRDCLR